MIKRSNFYGPLAIERLQSLEQNLGAVLPTEYRQFLLEHNGGVPDPDCFIVPGDEDFDGETSERQLACFFAVHDQKWSDKTPEGSLGYPLQEAWLDFQKNISENHVIPIGKDWNGSYICLGYVGEERGQIYFYDYDYEALRALSADFPSFVAALSPCEEG